MDRETRAKKVATLQNAAAEFRRLAEDGVEPDMHLVSANLLERRAARIATGEDDFSEVEFDGSPES